MIDIRQTEEYASYLEKIGWIVVRKNGANYFIKKIPIIGSVIKIQRPQQFNNLTIQQLFDKYHAFQIIIEPNLTTDYKRLTTTGYKLSNSPYLPTKTLQLDLTKSEKELFGQLSKDCRYSIRKAMKYKLSTGNSEIENFRYTWTKAVGWKRYIPPLDHLTALEKSFIKNVLFLMSAGLPRRNEVTAGAIFLIGDKTAYYWQAFTNPEGRSALIQYRIVWEGIKWAKKLGARVFDFEGVYDERFPNKSWLGFTHFKKSFGGREVSYPGAYIKNFIPKLI